MQKNRNAPTTTRNGLFLLRGLFGSLSILPLQPTELTGRLRGLVFRGTQFNSIYTQEQTVTGRQAGRQTKYELGQGGALDEEFLPLGHLVAGGRLHHCLVWVEGRLRTLVFLRQIFALVPVHVPTDQYRHQDDQQQYDR